MGIKISVITSLYRCEKYLEGYLNYVSNISNPMDVEILLLHNDPTKEELDIINKKIVDIPYIKHIIVKDREPLYATWNRGIKMAQGEYCAVWNVDDIRTPDSLFLQAQSLDENPNAMIAYGNIYESPKYGLFEGRFVTEPDFIVNPQPAYYRHLFNCFPMWRKSLNTLIGYFDEQLHLVADFEFQLRTVFAGYEMTKVNKLLGYYTVGIGNEGRLSQSSKLQTIEDNVVYRRYYRSGLINIIYLLQSFHYADKNRILFFGEWHSLIEYIPDVKRLSNKYKKSCVLLLIKAPLDIARYVKHEIFNK